MKPDTRLRGYKVKKQCCILSEINPPPPWACEKRISARALSSKTYRVCFVVIQMKVGSVFEIILLFQFEAD